MDWDLGRLLSCLDFLGVVARIKRQGELKKMGWFPTSNKQSCLYSGGHPMVCGTFWTAAPQPNLASSRSSLLQASQGDGNLSATIQVDHRILGEPCGFAGGGEYGNSRVPALFGYPIRQGRPGL